MTGWKLAALAATLTATAALAQVPPVDEGTPSVATGSVPLTYTGGDSSVSIGLNQDGHSNGELMHVFGNNGEHAIVGQLWWDRGGAGGVQADYNWLFGTTLEQAERDPDSVTVAKLSFALDQNADKDRQATVGIAVERKEFFANLFLAGKVGGSSDAGTLLDQHVTTTSGTDALGNYVQSQTEVSTTALQSQAYSYTIGLHGGHFSDALTARFNGGFDRAKGRQGASESTYSLGVDKYLGVRGWSVSGLAEHSQLSDPVNGHRSDDRFWMFLRYEFGGGGAFTPTSDAGNTAWIKRALHQPVTGHPRTFRTYVTRGKTTTTVTPGTREYTALRPLARDDSASVAANSGANPIDVLANDTDPDGGTLTITAVTAAANGVVQIAGNHVVYTPGPDFSGSDHFSYTVANPKGLSASANVSVTVTAAPQQPPIAADDQATTAAATPVTIGVLANDHDPGGGTLVVTAVTPPSHGTARINGDNTVTYTPLPGFSGTDTFIYTISNGHGGSASARVTITVQASPLGPPVARNDSATTAFQQPVTIDVLANDSSPAGYGLSVTGVSAAAHGTTALAGGAGVTYTPLPGFSGSDSFSYTISDGHGGSAGATVTIDVAAPIGALIARDDSAKTAQGTPVTIDVLANDRAPQGLSLSLVGVTQPAHGSAKLGGGGGVIYQPAAGFAGNDEFKYTVSDGLEQAVATVTISVGASNPIAQNDTATTAFNTPVVIAVLANDSDPNSYALTVSGTTTPLHGSVQVNPNNTVTYTPQSTFAGSDAFTYTIANGHGGSATASVAITVGPPTAVPVAKADSATTPFNTPVSIAVLANDSDPNSLPLSVSSVTQPAHGSAAINGNGSITYTPASNYSGPDSFDYTVSNGYTSTSTTVSVTVQAPLPPVAVNDSVTTPFGLPINIAVLANDSDPNGLPLTVQSFTQPTSSGATLTLNPDKTFTYFPDKETVGTDTFTYTISNGYYTATATVTVHIQPPLPAPNAGSFTVPSSTVCTPNGNSCDICLDDHITPAKTLGLSLSVSGTTAQGGMVVVGPSSGTCQYDATYTSPDPSSTGTVDSFTYTIKDSYGRSSTGTVTLTIGFNG